MKNVYISGISKGIGAEFSKQYQKKGFITGGFSRSTPSHSDYDFHSIADTSSYQEVKKAITEFIDQYKKIDILIINAGTGKFTHPKTLDLKRELLVVDTNLVGPLNILRTLDELEMLSNMNILIIGSIASYRGLWGAAGYCATKASVRSLWEGYYGPFMKRNIKFQLTEPGYIATDMVNDLYFPKPFQLSKEVFVKKVIHNNFKTPRLITSRGSQLVAWVISQLPFSLINFVQSKINYDSFFKKPQ